MGRMVVKTARDRDQYLIWSSVVDAPIAGPGTRAEALAWLTSAERDRWRMTAPDAEEALSRADVHGSSARGLRDGRWDDEPLPVVSGSPDDGWYRIRRERLTDYADALGRDDEAAAQALLECWQRHDEDDE